MLFCTQNDFDSTCLSIITRTSVIFLVHFTSATMMIVIVVVIIIIFLLSF